MIHFGWELGIGIGGGFQHFGDGMKVVFTWGSYKGSFGKMQGCEDCNFVISMGIGGTEFICRGL